MTTHASISVIGAGSYGTALAITLARNGHPVLLWGHNPAHLAQLQAERCNSAFLPDVPFPDNLELEPDLARAIAASRDLLVVVPSHVFGDVLKQIKPHLRSESRIVWATKGLERETGRLLQDVARDILGDATPLAVISGPTFAKELAAGLPTAIALAAKGFDVARMREHLLAMDGVTDVHDLHAWTITSGMPSLSAHVTVTGEALAARGWGDRREHDER